VIHICGALPSFSCPRCRKRRTAEAKDPSSSTAVNGFTHSESLPIPVIFRRSLGVRVEREAIELLRQPCFEEPIVQDPHVVVGQDGDLRVDGFDRTHDLANHARVVIRPRAKGPCRSIRRRAYSFKT
jgi:hypothetical protein